MNLRQYNQAFRTAVKNLRDDYHEARRLGMDNLAKELADKIYELGFNQNQLLRAQLKSIDPLIEKYQDEEEVKDILLEFRDKLTELVNDSTITNRDFVIKWLEAIDK
ncbi:hypothetical protein KY314_01335 [Candidatus Woesearchaeota archaeon]|nr:hypothetical protein [Candidatus Woesearchaeota archaeon]